VQLHASRRLLRCDNERLNLEHALRLERSHLRHQLRSLDDDLNDAGPVAQQQERETAQPALVMKPAGDTHALAGVVG
jgi:hypothetical protein